MLPAVEAWILNYLKTLLHLWSLDASYIAVLGPSSIKGWRGLQLVVPGPWMVEAYSPYNPQKWPWWTDSSRAHHPLLKLSACSLGAAKEGIFSPCMGTKLLQSCWTLCDPMDCSLPGSSVYGILQARILEWVAMPSSRGSSQARDQTQVSCSSCIAGRCFIAEPPGKPIFLP